MPEEVVVNINPDNLPWYINIFLKNSSIDANITWHIHSSVSNEKIPKIKDFVKNLRNASDASKINIRLIFKSGKLRTTNLIEFIYNNEIYYLKKYIFTFFFSFSRSRITIIFTCCTSCRQC